MSGSSSSSSSIAFSSSLPPPPTKYDVFLSFRGEDTRDGFTSHLHAALRLKKIQTFKDDEKLGRGEEISPSLQRAIEETIIYVIIFSQQYASSRWCLDELTKILECKEKYGRAVIPIFYKVDPSNVRHQRGSYADAFVKHEQRFKDKVPGWKAALTKAAGLSGWDSQVIRPESKLVEDIVNDILRKLDSSSVSDYQGLIGVDKHVEKIQSMLDVEPAGVRIIGIWGMGGIGKTTIARAVYHKVATQYESSCVINVEEEIKTRGIQYVQMNDLLGVHDSYSKSAKHLLVIDNVNNSGQFKDLIGRYGYNDLGTRIIVTSRDLQVLKNIEANEIYEVMEMDIRDSLQLFSLHAFKQNYPIEDYMDLTEKVLNYAKGIPLALKVLGSLLYGRTREEWESELQKLKKLPDLEIFNVLKASYDGLDEEQKDIFLDIACFYRGHDMNTVKQALDSCGFSAAIGIRVLIDRGLISNLKGEIVMHDLIQEMGQEIVRQQCVNDPGKRSRLWRHEDIYQVLRKNKGTDAIQCIFLDMCKIKKVQLHAETFKRMDNLRLLQFYKSSYFWEDSNVYLPTFLGSLPDELRFLRWDGFPQRSLPQIFFPENLVELDLHNSLLEQLWEEDQHFPNLKRLDLSHSWKLIRVPDFSQFPNVEEIILSHCRELDVVYSSCFLSKLNYLRLDGCQGLRSLNVPSNILSVSSGLVILYLCCSLETFSVSSRTKGVLFHGCSRNEFKSLLKFHNAKGRMIGEDVSDTFGPIVSAKRRREPANDIHLLNSKVMRRGLLSMSYDRELNELCCLDLSNCKSLSSLPFDFCKMKLLRRLYLRGCSNLEDFPEISEPMENLMVLILDKTAIQELPSSLHHLVGLEDLSLHKCQSLESIPSSIGSLSKLCKLDLTCCESLKTIPSSIFKLKLTNLDLQGCSIMRTFPANEIMEPVESFKRLFLTKTAVKEIPFSSFNYLVGLQTLRLNLCRHLEFLPDSIGRLSSLRELWLDGSNIVNLPESIAHLSSLTFLNLSGCKRLECIPELPQFLKQLMACDCPSIRKVMSSAKFKLPSDSKEGIFKFLLTNSQELDPSAHSNIVDDAWHRMLQDTYRAVFFCFPGSAVPRWFPYCCKGNSVTLNKDSLNWCNDDTFIGFALSVVLGLESVDDFLSDFIYIFKFESDDGTYVTRNYFTWNVWFNSIDQDHTILWKYHLDYASINQMLSHAHNFTFKICGIDVDYEPSFRVKVCGICPLYTKEKVDNARAGDSSNLLRFSNNDIEEASGTKAA